jgi:hypothetical protein
MEDEVSGELCSVPERFIEALHGSHIQLGPSAKEKHGMDELRWIADVKRVV